MAVFRKVERISRVISTYEIAYPDPIVLQAGDVISVGRRDTEWPGFIWCSNAEGKSGWVADAVLELHGSTAIASRHYTAIELHVSEGEMVTIQEEYGGWSWCTNSQGRSGWIPDSHLAP